MGVVVQLSDARDPRASLAPLLALVEEDMGHVNRIILDRARSNVELIPDLARHLIESGGKRLRPMLTIAAAKLCGYRGDGHVRLAASVEFMHTATLLHDDVVDESDLRRGKTAARLLWGNEASVLVGDFLLGQAFKMMVDVGSLGCLRILSDAAAVIAEGEVMQLITAKNTETTEDDYLAVIDAKTAALFAAAAEVGAVIANRPKSEAAGLGPTAAISASPSSSSTTRSIIPASSRCSARASATISARARSRFPWCSAIAAATAQERAFWQRTLQDGEIGEDDLAEAMGLMQKHQCLERHHGARAPLWRHRPRRARHLPGLRRRRRRCSRPSSSASTARSSCALETSSRPPTKRDARPAATLRRALPHPRSANRAKQVGPLPASRTRRAPCKRAERGQNLADGRRQPQSRRFEIVAARARRSRSGARSFRRNPASAPRHPLSRLKAAPH